MTAREANHHCKTPSGALIVSLFVAILALNSSIAYVLADQKQEPGLEIHYLFKPEHCDRKAIALDFLTLHYKGALASDGTVFDSSYERNEPMIFQLGVGQQIKGWDKGLLGVCAGEKRKLVIPPHLGYGQDKHELVPPGSTLVFEIAVEKVEDGSEHGPENIFADIDRDKDNRLSRKEVAEFVKRQLSMAKNRGDPATIEDPDQAQMVEDIFLHEDKDRDDFISHDEFSGPKHDHVEL